MQTLGAHLLVEREFGRNDREVIRVISQRDLIDYEHNFCVSTFL